MGSRGSGYKVDDIAKKAFGVLDEINIDTNNEGLNIMIKNEMRSGAEEAIKLLGIENGKNNDIDKITQNREKVLTRIKELNKKSDDMLNNGYAGFDRYRAKAMEKILKALELDNDSMFKKKYGDLFEKLGIQLN